MSEGYITEEEKCKCKAVIKAFGELYDSYDIIAVEVGKYGIAVMQWYFKGRGFEQITMFTTSKELFDYLWEQWLEYELYHRMEGTEWEEDDFDIKYQKLGKIEQEKFMEKRNNFWKLYLDNL